MRSRSAIEFQDIVAATFVVGPDLIEADFKTIHDAIANLPVLGGDIFCLSGTLDIPSTIVIPDKMVSISGCGAGATTLSMPTFVGPMFQVSDGQSVVRWFEISGFSAVGGSVAGQEFWQFDDENGRANCNAYGLRITGFETIVNWAQYDESYFNQSIFSIWNSYCQALVTGSVLVVTPNPAGSFLGATAFKAFNSDFQYDPSGGAPFLGFSADAECDLWMDECRYFYLQKGTSFNGISCSETIFVLWNGTGDVTFYGNSWDTADHFDNSTGVADFGGQALIVYDGFSISVDISVCANVCWRVLHGRSDFAIKEFLDQVGDLANPAIEVRQSPAFGDRHHSIHNIEFRRSSSPLNVFASGCILLASVTYVHIYAVHFFSTITGATITETGTSDFNLGVGNSGLNNGTGMTIIGAGSKFVIGDYNLA